MTEAQKTLHESAVLGIPISGFGTLFGIWCLGFGVLEVTRDKTPGPFPFVGIFLDLPIHSILPEVTPMMMKSSAG